MTEMNRQPLPASAPALSRPFNFRLGFGIPLAAMLVLLACDPSAVDFAIARWSYSDAGGFVGRNSWFLEYIMHIAIKDVVVAFGAVVNVAFVASLLRPRWHRWRRPLGYLVLALALSTAVTKPLKSFTEVHCPWSLVEFGGGEVHTPLLSERAPTAKPGRCWPGGHASTGFSLFALFFVLRDSSPRLARAALLFALGLGTALSLGRMLQGAHFLSHNIWTALLDWTICLGLYRLVLYRAPPLAVTQEVMSAPQRS